MDCKFLKSPIAGDISPPRFKHDKFLHKQDKNIRLEHLWENKTNAGNSLKDKRLTEKPLLK